eukprot:CAMPEP_0202465568 /NCGR_PEP_ID=MMETSP1360-20130828/65980_1 /ASSEMBLY_ACC=CAM_ASM_000848 /TAXON_ID=515479 /ORGANISM="Licmophora paradoxa, Strain CCMP2313" /LENGTH=192 /DNA_ID=CAMNT_0049089339 /DNA_START=343 /DNA_END=921 /DNA_ORIENTATION=+
MEGDVFGAFCSSPWRVMTGKKKDAHGVISDGGRYYGSGEAFLWRLAKPRITPTKSVEEQINLESTTEVFLWTGKNRNVQACTSLSGELVVGGGGADDANANEDGTDQTQMMGSGIALRANLERGFSDPCLTFGCPSLPTANSSTAFSSSADTLFEIANMEVWTLTPVNDTEQAEKLELGRQFVFDHGNFVIQ